MNRHAGPPPDPNAPPPVPEPTYAERARTLVHRARTGTLATLSRRHPGHPFASLMPYALDETGRPIFLISSMAIHTQNLAGDPRASLFVAEPDWSGDPLAAGRITLMGTVEARPGGRARRGARGLPRPPRERLVLGRLRGLRLPSARDRRPLLRRRLRGHGLDRRRGVPGGPGRPAGGRGGGDSRAHEPRPLRTRSSTYARGLGGAPDAEAATMVAVDRLGFRLRIRSGGRLHAERIPFPEEVTSADDARRVLIRMLQDLRARDLSGRGHRCLAPETLRRPRARRGAPRDAGLAGSARDRPARRVRRSPRGSTASSTRSRATSTTPATGTGAPSAPFPGAEAVEREIAEARQALDRTAAGTGQEKA